MIPLPFPPKINKIKENLSSVEIEGLYPGYGVTMGNVLRRVLLSSLKGAAITQVKIKNVLHEFSTLNGVMEDVVRILINLKKINFFSFAEEPQTISLKIKGEKEVKAKDFKLTSELKLANPQEHIATLTKQAAELEIEATVESGVGYEPLERREIKKPEVGVLPVDAIFTPVIRVGVAVENMRVGKRTDFDCLKLEIETNGVITPEEAFQGAVEVLLSQVKALEIQAPQKPPVKKIKEDLVKSKKENAGGEAATKTQVDDLKISERTKNILLKNGLKTAGGLSRKSRKFLAGVDGLGGKAIEEIAKSLKKLGLELKD
ncbi:MAG: DNA-directed RNA polymerase subunit alpha [Patescibacteria group bacterium]|nr:DNA-directed RNA polymerase subunit alpha [Patescibacteria group bacterium]